MITLIFTLNGLLYLMIIIMIHDTKIMIKNIKKEIYESFDHDNKIYPDYIS